jgi:hypothetical protein
MKNIELKEELTPQHLRCVPASCPTIYALSDGDLLIIGATPSADLLEEIKGKIGANEDAVVLSPAFFQNLR